MITPTVQRWRAGRARYRPAGELIRTSAYDVAPIALDRPAKAFVERHHYSASYPAARERIGLYRRAELVGVAVFSVPANARALDVLPCDRELGVELGRFVLLDEVPGNGETWFLGRAFELLKREGYAGVVSFSDPVARSRADGAVIFPGHIGAIYQGHNAVYYGRSKAERRRLLPDGTAFHNRAAAKIRARDRGWRYAAALLERHGAEPLRADEDAGAWLDRWLARLTRPLQHAGNHRYCWALDRRLRRRLPASLPYPKVRCAA